MMNLTKTIVLVVFTLVLVTTTPAQARHSGGWGGHSGGGCHGGGHHGGGAGAFVAGALLGAAVSGHGYYYSPNSYYYGYGGSGIGPEPFFQPLGPGGVPLYDFQMRLGNGYAWPPPDYYAPSREELRRRERVAELRDILRHDEIPPYLRLQLQRKLAQLEGVP